MTVDVRLVTCAALPVEDPDTPLLARELAARGARVAIDDWRDPSIDWTDAAVTVLRSPWDYVDAVDAFVGWARAASLVTELWNPVELVAWNVHKSYLLELANAGAPIVPTVLLLQGSAASLDGISDAQGWNTVVVKPAVGIGAQGAGRFDVGDARGQVHLDALLGRGDALVQPFVASIASEGELSVVCIEGRATHAVRKYPAAGDYRVHDEWGGRAEASDAGPAARALAERVVSALPAPTLYARIDLVRIGKQLHVLEVEATEPSLWLDLAPAASTVFADAVLARVAR